LSEIFIEISKVVYQKLEIVKVITQRVNQYVLYIHLNPKKGKGKLKKGEQVWGKFEVA